MPKNVINLSAQKDIGNKLEVKTSRKVGVLFYIDVNVAIKLFVWHLYRRSIKALI
jgi:hypothetical protein